jgi:Circularly permuted ATP-grasp type 2
MRSRRDVEPVSVNFRQGSVLGPGAKSATFGGVTLAANEPLAALLPGMRGVRPPGDLWIGVAGLDLVRDHTGRFHVLEDNVRTPSGYAYAAAARRALAAHLDVAPEDAPRPLDDVPAMLGAALRAAAPGDGDPYVIFLSDGEGNAAYYEHDWAATALGIPLVEPQDLELRGDRLRLDGRPVDVVYRRTDADRLDTEVGVLQFGPQRAGTLGIVNGFGTGVADDKLTHAYVEDMIRFYLDDEPLLASVETFDLGRPEVVEHALDAARRLRRARHRDPSSRGGARRRGHARGGACEPGRLRGAADGDALQPSDGDRRPAAAAPRRPAPVHLPRPRRRDARDARRPHARRLRRPRAGRQLLAERRRQGHVGAGMRPPIGVTGSDVRLENRAEPLAEGDPPQSEMALGMVDMRVVVTVRAA